jgi:hypothetical protein
MANSLTSQKLISLVHAFKDEPVDVSLHDVLISVDMMSNDEIKAILDATQPDKSGSFGERLFDELTQKLEVERLAQVASTITRPKMIKCLPILASLPSFWPADDVHRAQFLEEVSNLVKIDLDAGLQLFGMELGELTLGLLLRQTTVVRNECAPSLLTGLNRAASAVLFKWFAEHPAQLQQFVRLLASPETEIINALARIQIKLRLPIDDPKAWSDLIVRHNKTSRDQLSDAAVVVGYASAVRMELDSSKNVAAVVFDSLKDAIEKMRLSTAEENYLKRSLPPSTFGWSLSNTVTKSAVSKWPMLENDLGVLSITRNRQHLLDILGEIIAKNGTRALGVVISDPCLSIEAKEVITKLLTPAKKNSLLFWWM